MGNKIYKKLHGHIVGKGLTDKEVAAAIGISAQAMSDKIQGKTSFSLEQVVAIGTYLNFSDADYRKYFIIPQSIALGIDYTQARDKENQYEKSAIRADWPCQLRREQKNLEN